MTKNFFRLYRKLVADGLSKFVTDHPNFESKKEILEGIRLLKNYDYEGGDLQGFYNSYIGAEDEFNSGAMNDVGYWKDIVHDTVIDFLCDVTDVILEGKELNEIVNNIIKNPELKKFIDENHIEEVEEG